MKKIMLFAAVGLFAAFSMTSCSDDNNNNAEPKSFKVRMTDSPGNYAALNMTITGVDAYLDGQGWVNLSSQTQTVNVASLTNGSEITIANATNIQTGVYTHVRVKFSSTASINVNATGSGSGFNFNLTWNVPQEIDIAIQQEVTASTGANILLDFNVAQSIIETGGNYFIQPVITLVTNENTGVKGHVSGATTAAVVFSDGTHTYSGYINAQGNFMIKGMAAGTYTCTVWYNSATDESHTVNNVVVTEGEIYSMGEITIN